MHRVLISVNVPWVCTPGTSHPDDSLRQYCLLRRNYFSPCPHSVGPVHSGGNVQTRVMAPHALGASLVPGTVRTDRKALIVLREEQIWKPHVVLHSDNCHWVWEELRPILWRGRWGRHGFLGKIAAQVGSEDPTAWEGGGTTREQSWPRGSCQTGCWLPWGQELPHLHPSTGHAEALSAQKIYRDIDR